MTATRIPHRRLVALAAVSVLALTGCGDDGSGDSTADDPSGSAPTSDAAASPSEAAPTETAPTETAAADPTSEAGGEQVVTAYYVGKSPRRDVLFPEEVSGPAGDGGYVDALMALTRAPSDPDYRTLWSDGDFADVNFEDGGNGTTGVYRVELADPGLAQRPSGMSAAEARLALQQVVHTLQEATDSRAPVAFSVDGADADTVLGVDTSAPVKRGGFFSTSTLMSITTPAEGEQVTGAFTARGGNNGFEATAAWQLLDENGTEVKAGSTTARGWLAKRLYPWKTRIDVSDLPPGTYVLRFFNDDPTGGTEGSGPDEDTRTITVS